MDKLRLRAFKQNNVFNLKDNIANFGAMSEQGFAEDYKKNPLNLEIPINILKCKNYECLPKMLFMDTK